METVFRVSPIELLQLFCRAVLGIKLNRADVIREPTFHSSIDVWLVGELSPRRINCQNWYYLLRVAWRIILIINSKDHFKSTLLTVQITPVEL